MKPTWTISLRPLWTEWKNERMAQFSGLSQECWTVRCLWEFSFGMQEELSIDWCMKLTSRKQRAVDRLLALHQAWPYKCWLKQMVLIYQSRVVRQNPPQPDSRTKIKTFNDWFMPQNCIDKHGFICSLMCLYTVFICIFQFFTRHERASVVTLEAPERRPWERWDGTRGYTPSDTYRYKAGPHPTPE